MVIETQDYLTMDQVDFTDWDLNFFYREDWDGKETVYDEHYTCQPSLYVVTKDNRSVRYYLESFTISKKETEEIASGLGYTDDDFFIGLGEVYPWLSSRIRTMLKLLPQPELVISGRSEIDSYCWIS